MFKSINVLDFACERTKILKRELSTFYSLWFLLFIINFLNITTTFLTTRKKRICKTGCGQERTPGKCDTPGFPLTDTAEVKYDHRRSQKLYMPRNHPRISQTSRVLLQSWRGNCDVQLLVYNSDPKKPDIKEIAKVTDYVVSYSCKGNVTLKEEREQTKKLIMA